MSIHEKQQKGLVSKDCNGVELPMIDGDVPDNGVGAAGVDNGNIVNHPYLENNPYRKLANDDDDNKDGDNNGDDNIYLMAAQVEITEKIIGVDEEITGDPDKETTGVPDKHTGVEMSDNRESIGVPNTEDNNMAAIDTSITEVVATLDQELRETNM